ncbi:hypothetical protein EVAR_20891_1 [Eumeta japonica]|uniref:Uncharacterized protein n=1 Tax=Eumeta variegata TaxID=151549 RepID=A0A4C1UVX9_EUMVA|nr:hypothetical protein EVAR_20891_1 [Eumeta japonica]
MKREVAEARERPATHIRRDEDKAGSLYPLRIWAEYHHVAARCRDSRLVTCTVCAHTLSADADRETAPVRHGGLFLAHRQFRSSLRPPTTVTVGFISSAPTWKIPRKPSVTVRVAGEPSGLFRLNYRRCKCGLFRNSAPGAPAAARPSAEFEFKKGSPSL